MNQSLTHSLIWVWAFCFLNKHKMCRGKNTKRLILYFAPPDPIATNLHEHFCLFANIRLYRLGEHNTFQLEVHQNKSKLRLYQIELHSNFKSHVSSNFKRFPVSRWSCQFIRNAKKQQQVRLRFIPKIIKCLIDHPEKGVSSFGQFH